MSQSQKPELACLLRTSFLLWQIVTAGALQKSSALRHFQLRTAAQEQMASWECPFPTCSQLQRTTTEERPCL